MLVARGEVHDPATLEPAMAGCQAAYSFLLLRFVLASG
jgi:hypothetical protein